ncbi:MAG: SOS cell division inhibitor, partial [Cytophagales bacterium]|nr:SOS cell division inhibitor [Rhizobacter sp.]
AAPLRLALHPAGADQLALRVLKRRGPPLLSPLHLALPPVLPAAALRRAQAWEDADAQAQPLLRAASFINLA